VNDIQQDATLIPSRMKIAGGVAHLCGWFIFFSVSVKIPGC
jgi:hypothetical protein